MDQSPEYGKMRGYFKLKHECTFNISWFAILWLGIRIHINQSCSKLLFSNGKLHLIDDEKPLMKSNLIYRILIGRNNIDLF